MLHGFAGDESAGELLVDERLRDGREVLVSLARARSLVLVAVDVGEAQLDPILRDADRPPAPIGMPEVTQRRRALEGELLLVGHEASARVAQALERFEGGRGKSPKKSAFTCLPRGVSRLKHGVSQRWSSVSTSSSSMRFTASQSRSG